jgi:protease YdgD
MKIWCFTFLFVLAALSVAKAAEKDFHPGVIGTDDRVRVGATPGPWQAVGQVNGASYRNINRCTGTLVARNIVITAAHCLIDHIKGTPLPPHQIHFLAGPPGAGLKIHANAKCLRFHPQYPLRDPADPKPVALGQAWSDDIEHDVVAIVLDKDLDLEPAPMAKPPVSESDSNLVHAAYPMDRRYALSAHFNCRLKENEAGPVWHTDCDTHPASSGGPVFIGKGGELKLGAIMVAAVQREKSLAVPISTWAELVRGAACPAR